MPSWALAWLVTAVSLLAGALSAQVPLPPSVDHYGIRQWGRRYLDTDAYLLPIVDVDANYDHVALLRSDGRLFIWGPDNGQCRVPAMPFTGVGLADFQSYGIRPDGTVASWGSTTWAIPPLPSGVSYTQIATGHLHRLLLRSDGVVAAIGNGQFGLQTVPPLPAGVVAVKVASNEYYAAMLTNVGTVFAWGDNTDGQCNVPPLPAGVVYTDLACGYDHMIAVRSDGSIATWGSNLLGQGAVPALPAGVSYLKCEAGIGWSVAWRSDGQLVAWGTQSPFQSNLEVPATPPGTTLVDLAVGDRHGVALWSNGTVGIWGLGPAVHPSRGNSTVVPGDRFAGVACPGYPLVLRADGQVEGYSIPPLPPGVVYTKVGGGGAPVALRSDGQIAVWGFSTAPQLPALPPGVVYTEADTGWQHGIALRSDGEAVAFGTHSHGQCDVPPLPAGLSYVSVDALFTGSSLVRSDGALLYFGQFTNGMRFPASAGLSFVQGISWTGLRDDGAVEWSDGTTFPNPWGVYVVQIASSTVFAARRSDGRIVNLSPAGLGDAVPTLEPGTSYLDLASSDNRDFTARVGPTCTYVGIVPGCAGSRPAARLVPRDTPRIGRTLKVTLFDLPNDIAVLGMSFQRLPAPVDLGFLGMPGCSLAISPDAVLGIVGQSGKAKWQLPIPDQPSLVGVRFYNQAIVLDVGAGNPFGAVMSDAMEGVVGYP